MDHKLTELSYSIYSNKGAFALLLGSGVSRAAGIPTGWDIMIDLINQIAILEKKKFSTSAEVWFQEYFKEELDYSNLLEKLTRTTEERINLLRPYFEPSSDESNDDLKKPTKAHRKIAELVQAGYIRVIVTTNFDRLIENSLKDLGIEPVVISNPSHIENTIPLIHSKITVLKINGDYLDTKFLNIKSELSKYDSRLEEILKYIFENFGLLTCGWSAKWDSALVDILKSANKFRYSNYFLFTREATPELDDLRHHRRARLLKIEDADSLFEELRENIKALENGVINNPLSTEIAVARLKKYIVKEEHVISLSELVNNIAEDCHKKIHALVLPVPPTIELAKQIMGNILQYLAPLLPIVVEGGYWSKPYQERIWSSAIKKFGVQRESSGTSYEIWSGMAQLPLVVLRYHFGLASLMNSNWSALKMSLDIKLRGRNNGDFESLLQRTHLWRILRREHLTGVMGQNLLTPMSELLLTETKKSFGHLASDDIEFEDIFDYYEYICCLIHLKHNEGDYPPIGRFGWRSDKKYINFKKAQFEKEESEFELVKEGLFTDKEELSTAILKLEEVLKNERFY